MIDISKYLYIYSLILIVFFIAEGGPCGFTYVGLSGPPPTKECAKGLLCKNNICQPFCPDARIE